MVSFFKKLKYLIPDRPSLRYNSSGGTNTLAECLLAFQELFSVNINKEIKIIQNYENIFASITKTTNAFSFGAGRMGLYAILEALDIKKDDEIIIPAFTCVVVPNAILYHSAKPVYVDIDPEMFNIDVNKIESSITSKTKALYAQHTFGIPCNIKKIREIANRHNLYVIEDGAHALGSFVDGDPVGSLSDVGFFSTDRTKTIGTHVGGMVVTNNAIIAKKLNLIQKKSSFLSSFTTRKILITFIFEYIFLSPKLLWIGRVIQNIMIKTRILFYFSDELKTSKPNNYPFPCRLSSGLAKIGIKQLNGLEKNIKHRKKIVDHLEDRIKWNKNHKNVIKESVLLRYSFLVDDRSKFEALFHNRFDLEVWYKSVVHGRNMNLSSVGYKAGTCPVAEKVAKHIVNFPTHSQISINILKKELDKNWNWLQKHIVNDFNI
jgi:perosamine synthetase